MNPSPALLLFDATHTSHTRAQTGIQRVVRSLYAGLTLTQKTTGICFDPFLRAWRRLNAGELDHLRPGYAGSSSRGAKWPLPGRLAGHARRLIGSTPTVPEGAALLCPELFSPATAVHLPELFRAVRGPRVAIFHDAIGLKLPELSPPGTVARLPAYLRELLVFDGVAAVSEDSAASLREYWQWLGVNNPPPVQAIPNGLEPVPAATAGVAPAAPPRVLCVGTIEGRKNHLALLEACETLWTEGLVFTLELLGLARAETAGRALEKIAALQRAGRPLQYRGPAADAELHAAYRRAVFTVYPSLDEGFGFPVLESLQHGRPCICSARGALGESTQGGGCLGLPSVDRTSLAAAIRRLLTDGAELAALTAAARSRTFRSWADYTRELSAWTQSLARRA